MNGVNKVVHQLASLMQDIPIDVTVVGITKDNDHQTSARPYDLLLLKGKIRSFHINNEIKTFIDNLPEKTIIHFHGVLIPLFFSIARLLTKRGIPYVITPHGALLKRSMRHNYLLKKIYFNLIEKPHMCRAKAIHAITPQEKQAINQKIPKAPVHVIPNGYPYQLENDEAILQRNGQIVFGYIGRLSSNHKGLDQLITGFNNYFRDYGTGYLWLIGDGPDRHKLVHQANISAAKDHIIFHGEKHGAEKLALLDKMDVFIHPSRWDVLPTAILEAAAHRKPLLVTQATGFGEAIKKWQCGVVIEQGSPTEIAKALEACHELHQNNQLIPLGKQAEQMIKQDYNWHNIVRDIISDLYGIK